MIQFVLSIAIAYLLGLAVLGYLCVFWLSQTECKRRKASLLVTNLLTVTHFCFGVTGILIVPSYLYGKFKADLTNEVGISFAIAEFVVLFLVFVIVRLLNRKLQQFEAQKMTDA